LKDNFFKETVYQNEILWNPGICSEINSKKKAGTSPAFLMHDRII